jgi:hypothetical protein
LTINLCRSDLFRPINGNHVGSTKPESLRPDHAFESDWAKVVESQRVPIAVHPHDAIEFLPDPGTDASVQAHAHTNRTTLPGSREPNRKLKLAILAT